MHVTAPNRRSAFARGFTLIEVLIATALVLLLGLAIVQVFQVTSDTVATGTALSEITRNHKAVREVLARDFTGTDATGNEETLRATGIMDTAEMPFLTIVSTRVAAFPNSLAQDLDGDFTNGDDGFDRQQQITSADLDEDGNLDGQDYGGGDVRIPFTILGDRNFRTDTLSFFTRGDFRSQVNTDLSLSPLGAHEIFVQYGHLKLFNGAATNDWTNLDTVGGYARPGKARTGDVGTTTGRVENLVQRYASQFVLGRTAILLAPATTDLLNNKGVPAAVTDGVNDTPPPGYLYISRPWGDPDDMSSGESLLPLSSANGGSRIFVALDDNNDGVTDDRQFQSNVNGTVQSVEDGRADVAPVTAAEFRKRLDAVIPLIDSTENQWWQGEKTFGAILTKPNSGPSSGEDVWEPFIFWANPFLPDFSEDRNGDGEADQELFVDEASMAQRHHVLMSGAAQFIVEFAGDFLTQAADGSVLRSLPDGTIDFYINPLDVSGDGGGDSESSSAAKDTEPIRHIRWYGFPRDTNGDGIIARNLPEPSDLSDSNELSPDVLPLYDVAPWRGTDRDKPSTSMRWPFERLHPMGGLTFPNQPNETESYGFGSNDFSTIEVDWDGTYQVSWNSDEFGTYSTPAFVDDDIKYRLRPSLIRVIVGAVDPQSRLEGTIYEEHVFRVRGPKNFEPTN